MWTFSDLWEREIRREIKEAKIAEKRAAQAEVEARRSQHKHTSNEERQSVTPAASAGARPKSKLKARLRESKTLEKMSG